MGKSAVITGGVGDCVYAIPVFRKLGVDLVYVKENLYHEGEGSMYTTLKPLLESQGFECRPTLAAIDGKPLGFNQFDPSLSFHYNFDEWRVRPGRDRVHIIRNMMLHYRCYSDGWNRPFLHGFDEWKVLSEITHRSTRYKPNLLFLTARWRDNSPIKWVNVMEKHSLDWTNTYFIGHANDFINGMNEGIDLNPLWTKDLLDMATAIAYSRRLFCNQGVALTIAQGLGKPYWLEVKPGKTNTLFYTPNEHIL